MPDASTAQQIPASKSRPARERVLPVAQIYSVLSAEAQGRQAMATVIVGDERTTPKKHGLRASHHDWCHLVRTLAAEDPLLGELLRATLHVGGGQ